MTDLIGGRGSQATLWFALLAHRDNGRHGRRRAAARANHSMAEPSHGRRQAAARGAILSRAAVGDPEALRGLVPVGPSAGGGRCGNLRIGVVILPVGAAVLVATGVFATVNIIIIVA